jgi:hypothetical protein
LMRVPAEDMEAIQGGGRGAGSRGIRTTRVWPGVVGIYEFS